MCNHIRRQCRPARRGERAPSGLDGPRRTVTVVQLERDDAQDGPELRWTQDGSLAAALPYETTARQIAWSDDGARCLLVARPGGALVWDVERHQPLVHDPAVSTASFGPQGKWIAVADEDKRDVSVRRLP